MGNQKLRTYIQIHDKNETKAIVSRNLSRKHRAQVSRFKCGTLPLSIETGRYTDVDIEDRVCKVCNSNAIEDEEHFLLACTKLEDTRKFHLDRMKVDEKVPSKNNIERMKFMISREVLKDFCIMLEDMLERRKDILYNKVE